MTMLSEQRKQILTEKRVKLIECIKLNGLWAHLRSHKIVTEQDEKRIKLNKTSHEQIGKLLDHLAKGTDRDFEAFCDCLKEDNQEHVVAEFLRYSAPSPSNQDESDEVYTLAWHLADRGLSTNGICTLESCYESQSVEVKTSCNVREQLAGRYYCLRHISTAPEWAPEFALDSAEFYISLHLQKGETPTT
ncbi:hypothetical protein CAPTEDRAFT_209582 [Capitella teleta]|uniref:CARD domain-containing protein n=1 Tax=Capitella teleta TaxID=283909 RepID=R7T513_CAPTE|nr:hypothetical protein CAPTEDRAFT_209582 [Capitella teleta]|eukprot:ELT88242.1 hypothetical protein CAPTEDRAFT_209582 [Capitella teleta]